jgi:hypothetical protein
VRQSGVDVEEQSLKFSDPSERVPRLELCYQEPFLAYSTSAKVNRMQRSHRSVISLEPVKEFALSNDQTHWSLRGTGMITRLFNRTTR